MSTIIFWSKSQIAITFDFNIGFYLLRVLTEFLKRGKIDVKYHISVCFFL